MVFIAKLLFGIFMIYVSFIGMTQFITTVPAGSSFLDLLIPVGAIVAFMSAGIVVMTTTIIERWYAVNVRK